MTNPSIAEEARPEVGAGTPASRQISWYETFTYARRLAEHHGVEINQQLPIAGSIQWCGLPDDDARKMLALVLGGVREALINDAHQEAVLQAGEDIWAGENWSEVAREVLRRREIDAHRRKTA